MDATGLIFGLFGLVWVAFMGLNIAGVVFWIVMLVDALQRKNWGNESDKVLWILVIVLTNWIGALIYYFMIRKKLGKATGAVPPSQTTPPTAT